ncbi:MULTISPECIES: putative manganese transporter [Pseudoalteromonas]|uniref:Manganese transporter n=1 Tax=Pseudoalteromonas amylolytica TaxID=1859457 RepID=A0A1S1MW56_9GAMM|nr:MULTISPECIES: putative manganese transporter [Pseudoalteromonas]OHU88021.1 hypothetical protein BFC16_11545 [Pseudoalteromonas sp. JW3]OHU91461.1 hypothetical protein BET10_11665 [Pseudoalteromonas amylolytica]
MLSSSIKYRFYFNTLARQYVYNKRLILPLLLVCAIVYSPTRATTITTLADAFFQVAVFVAGTLYIYHRVVGRLPQLELRYLSSKSPALEVAFASVLGALPGCGGAIIVVTQYTQRQASFGSLVAVLTSTMGDAAFLLLAKKPLDGLLMIALGIAVGFVSGILVNTLPEPELEVAHRSHTPTTHNSDVVSRIASRLWQCLLIPCLLISLLLAANIQLGAMSYLVQLFGCSMAIFATLCWALDGNLQSSSTQNLETTDDFTLAVKDTHFVSVWVIASFMLYEIIVLGTGFDIATWFSSVAALTPMLGIIIGLLPGCGPQIIVATLYIQGVIPFSALAGNAISNDGDALFPAIALAPKAALLATCYSVLPALLVAYTIYWF